MSSVSIIEIGVIDVVEVDGTDAGVIAGDEGADISGVTDVGVELLVPAVSSLVAAFFFPLSSFNTIRLSFLIAQRDSKIC